MFLGSLGSTFGELKFVVAMLRSDVLNSFSTLGLPALFAVWQ